MFFLEERSLLFNSTFEDRRRFQASDLAWVLSNFLTSGVYHTNEVPGIKVVTDGMGMNVTLTKGAAFVRGYSYETTGRLSLTHDTADSQYDRIDRVILRLDTRIENRYIKAFIIKGLPAHEPVPPTLQRDEEIHEISLAQVKIRKGMSVIDEHDVKDERFDEEVCGLVGSLMTNKWDKELRNVDGKLQFLNDGKWITLMNTLELDPLTNFIGNSVNGSVHLTWTDPADLIVDGRYLAVWKGTRIVRKKGSYPVHENDGTIVIESGVKNAYRTTPFVDMGVVNYEEYYYAAFPFSVDNVFTIDDSSRVVVTPKPYFIAGVRIDTTNSNPTTAVQRIEGAAAFTQPNQLDAVFPFNQIKPCLLKNGIVQYYLNPNDFSKKVDGTASDITTGNDGDVMIEFPKIYWKFEKVGTDLFVRYSDGKVDEDFKPLAHTKGPTEKDKIYIGAYLGSWLNNKLRSLSGKAVHNDVNYSEFRSMAESNGSGYRQTGYYQILMLQILFLVKYKSLDSQTTLGRGYVDGNAAPTTTGGTNFNGMNFGETAGKQQMKFCGIEDFWGNYFYWVDGLVSATEGEKAIIKIGNTNFNNAGTGYNSYNLSTSTINMGGIPAQVAGTTELGFIMTSTGGSTSTYYCDSQTTYYNDRVLYFGGMNTTGGSAGVFGIAITDRSVDKRTFVGSRLSYV